MESIFEVLADYLTLGELFRLRRAIGTRAFDEVPHVADLAVRRLGLVRMAPTLRNVALCMATSRHRCRECGARTQRAVRVCHACAEQKNGYFELISRRGMALRWHGVRAGAIRRAYAHLSPASVRATGEFLYWRAVVDAVMASYGHAPAPE